LLTFKVTADDDRYHFARTRRLKTSADFAAVLAAPRTQSIRAARRFLSVNAAWTVPGIPPSNACRVRFGVTVGKRNARRAVDRTLIKRIVREACRHRAGEFERCAAEARAGIDVTLRLKSSLTDENGRALTVTQWRRQVRVECDALLERLLTELRERSRERADELK
jgi:ribonuclease P protein component